MIGGVVRRTNMAIEWHASKIYTRAMLEEFGRLLIEVTAYNVAEEEKMRRSWMYCIWRRFLRSILWSGGPRTRGILLSKHLIQVSKGPFSYHVLHLQALDTVHESYGCRVDGQCKRAIVRAHVCWSECFVGEWCTACRDGLGLEDCLENFPRGSCPAMERLHLLGRPWGKWWRLRKCELPSRSSSSR